MKLLHSYPIFYFGINSPADLGGFDHASHRMDRQQRDRSIEGAARLLLSGIGSFPAAVNTVYGNRFGIEEIGDHVLSSGCLAYLTTIAQSLRPSAPIGHPSVCAVEAISR
jgi:hypothetical protein